MLNTKNLITQDTEIPSTWVFEYYLNLTEKLSGQNVQIKSIFNPNDKTPSMWIFYEASIGEYKFKDFSTGTYGSKIDIVKILFNLDYSKAVFKIIHDFNDYTLKNGEYTKVELVEQSKYKVDNAVPRIWTEFDKNFWLKFNIDQTILEKYNVKALEYYNMSKEEFGSINSIRIDYGLLYGYYTKDNELYKIYQPTNKKYKFIKLAVHTQGLDQLQYNQPYLVICSSLKDVMSLMQFGYNIEAIAPDSENTIIKPYVIEHLKSKYQKIITLFDNDTAGKEAINKYHKLYDINGGYLELSKDLSDSVRDFGFTKTHEVLKPLLKKLLTT